MIPESAADKSLNVLRPGRVTVCHLRLCYKLGESGMVIYAKYVCSQGHEHPNVPDIAWKSILDFNLG